MTIWADRVEVEVLGLVQAGEQLGYLPALAGEDLTEQPLLLLEIVVVVVELGVAAEQERRAGLAGLMDRVGGGELARGEVGEHLPVQLQVVGNGVDGEVAADVAAEPRFLAEGQPADGGVEPVGADHEVEATGGCARTRRRPRRRPE